MAKSSSPVSWVWLSSPELDFGGVRPGRQGDIRGVWLHADPFGALELSRFADPHAVRRAFRRLSLRYHPDKTGDDPEALNRFLELQRAAAATRAHPDVSVEPTTGAWWKFAGFTQPDPLRRTVSAVAGLSFELGDLHRVPLDGRPDHVHISYDGEHVSLALAYSRARRALPVRLARLAAATEQIESNGSTLLSSAAVINRLWTSHPRHDLTRPASRRVVSFPE